jgi:hypothetical protein
MSAVERVLDRLERVKRSGSGWTAHCPAHEDRVASLSVGEGDDGRVLVRCHAGCSVEDVVATLGLELRDLFEAGGGWSIHPKTHATPQHPGCTLDAFAAAKRLPADFLRSLGVADMTHMRAPAVRIPYLTEDGTTIAVRMRVALDGEDRFRWKAGTVARGKLYGLSRLTHARDVGYVLLVEGESDAMTAWHRGFPAIALPGAAMWDETRNAADLPSSPPLPSSHEARCMFPRRLPRSPSIAHIQARIPAPRHIKHHQVGLAKENVPSARVHLRRCLGA